MVQLFAGLACIAISHALTPCQDQITRWWRARLWIRCNPSSVLTALRRRAPTFWRSVLLVLPAAWAASTSCLAQERVNVAPETRERREILIGLQELDATGNDRHIRTVNLDLFFHTDRFRKFEHLKFYGGLTVSRASGTITQITGSLEAGTLGNTTFDSAATGVGPILAARAEFLRREHLSAAVDGSAGVLLYDRDFPAGGSRYEFMWRIGPALSYRMNDRDTLSLTYTAMHVSNGQGKGPHNPTYNATGGGVQLLRVF